MRSGRFTGKYEFPLSDQEISGGCFSTNNGPYAIPQKIRRRGSLRVGPCVSSGNWCKLRTQQAVIRQGMSAVSEEAMNGFPIYGALEMAGLFC